MFLAQGTTKLIQKINMAFDNARHDGALPRCATWTQEREFEFKN